MHLSLFLYPDATIIGPAIICEGAEIRKSAFIRGSAIVGRGAVVGRFSVVYPLSLVRGYVPENHILKGDALVKRE